MATFRFNFSSSDDEAENTKDETQTADIPILKEAKEYIFRDNCVSMPSELDAEVLTLADGQLCLRHVLALDVEHMLESGSNGANRPSDILKATDINSDLVPLVYEGGHKVWECSEDLVEFLFESGVQMAGRRVIELGCGAGLPGAYALLNGASVDFQDYNEEVLEHVTIPNILLNAPGQRNDQQRDTSRKSHPFHLVQNNCRFFSGDWGSLLDFINPSLNEEETYDIILSSETIYNMDSQKRLYHFIERHLKKHSGVAYIAAKTCYFGVGGGTRSFEQLVTSFGKLEVSVCRTYSTGVQREILSMKFKK